MTDSLFGNELQLGPPPSTDPGTGSPVVLARKWRPAQFSDVVGQTHIVRTLMNAVKLGRIHQAYLFTGTRGTGKTSVARIFSKVLRCEKAEWKTDFLCCCDQCASCREITHGNSVDVQEIDGASNNGVEAIREIRENAKYMPAHGSRKIYIIDEVHMLTTAAFNALLKTLEEPPAHVIFIFATTEPHKIPATILSRVQRFDFRRVSLAQIQGRLAQIALAEKVEAENGALALIARAAEGSMRDSLSLLDQVIAFSGNSLTTESVRDSIGLVEGQILAKILRALFERKPIDALSAVDQVYSQGHDLRVLTRSLIEMLHGVILAKAGVKNLAALEFPPEQWDDIVSLSQLRELEEFELIFQALHQSMEWIARSPQPKIVLDVLLIKCSLAEALGTIDPKGSPYNDPKGSPSIDPQGHSQGSNQNSGGPNRIAQSTNSSTTNAPPKRETGTPVVPALELSPVEKIRASLSEAPSSSVPSPKPLASVIPPRSTVTPIEPPADGVPSWEKFIHRVRETRPLLASILEHGECLNAPTDGTGQLHLGFSPKEVYYREQLQARSYQEQLLGYVKNYFGQGVGLKIEVHEGGESLATRKEREFKEREKNAKEAVQNHPVLQEARAIFGGEFGPIELTEGTS